MSTIIEAIMATLVVEGNITDAERRTYINGLYLKARSGDKEAGDAFVQLGKIAAGRKDLPLARELFQKLDNGGIQKNG